MLVSPLERLLFAFKVNCFQGSFASGVLVPFSFGPISFQSQLLSFLSRMAREGSQLHCLPLIPLLFNSFLVVIHGPFPSIKSKGLEAQSRTKQLSTLPLNNARENLNNHR